MPSFHEAFRTLKEKLITPRKAVIPMDFLIPATFPWMDGEGDDRSTIILDFPLSPYFPTKLTCVGTNYGSSDNGSVKVKHIYKPDGHLRQTGKASFLSLRSNKDTPAEEWGEDSGGTPDQLF